MKVKTGIRRLNDPAAVQLTNKIITGATGKAELDNSNSPISVANLTTVAEEGATALDQELQAESDLAMKRSVRVAKMEELRKNVIRFAEYADAIYAGDRVKLQAIGLDVRTPTPSGLMPAPENMRSSAGALEGSIRLRWAAVPKRGFYTVECAAGANGPWTLVYQGKRSTTLSVGLTPGGEYFFRARAHGTAGAGPWSDITKTRAS